MFGQEVSPLNRSKVHGSTVRCPCVNIALHETYWRINCDLRLGLHESMNRFLAFYPTRHKLPTIKGQVGGCRPWESSPNGSTRNAKALGTSGFAQGVKIGSRLTIRDRRARFVDGLRKSGAAGVIASC